MHARPCYPVQSRCPLRMYQRNGTELLLVVVVSCQDSSLQGDLTGHPIGPLATSAGPGDRRLAPWLSSIRAPAIDEDAVDVSTSRDKQESPRKLFSHGCATRIRSASQLILPLGTCQRGRWVIAQASHLPSLQSAAGSSCDCSSRRCWTPHPTHDS